MRSFVVKLAEEFENELHISSEQAKAKASHVYVKVLMRMMSPICPIDRGEDRSVN